MAEDNFLAPEAKAVNEISNICPFIDEILDKYKIKSGIHLEIMDGKMKVICNVDEVVFN